MYLPPAMQPEQLSSLSRTNVRHQPKPKRQASGEVVAVTASHLWSEIVRVRARLGHWEGSEGWQARDGKAGGGSAGPSTARPVGTRFVRRAGPGRAQPRRPSRPRSAPSWLAVEHRLFEADQWEPPTRRARARQGSEVAGADGRTVVIRRLWRHNGAMPSVQIKDVPESTHAVLRQRAAAAHQSLQEYLRSRLIAEASQPTLEEVLDRAGGRSGGSISFADAVKTVQGRSCSSLTPASLQSRWPTTAPTGMPLAPAFAVRRWPRQN